MLSESNNSLPISLIRQYCFCPRIPYFADTLNINPTAKSWQHQGVEYHQRQQMLNKRRNLCRYQIEQGKIEHNISLQSASLQLHGICDGAIFTPTEIIALEFKLTTQAPSKAHQLQLAAYALVLSDTYKRPATRGFILYGERGETQEVRITEKMTQQVLHIRDAILTTQKSALIPHSSASAAQCGQCEYVNFCADRDY